jgi:transposase
VIADKLPNALNILDRFHIVKKLKLQGFDRSLTSGIAQVL